jgi:hypothetical protein
MSGTWDLRQLLADLHHDIEQRLAIARRSMGHPVSKGDASEGVWLELLRTYLPKRYEAIKAHVVDSQGQFSNQIDVVIVDRQYSPFIFCYQEQMVVPAESVYAVFEAKQSLNADLVAYAQNKAASVRALHRTSLPIPYAAGVYKPKSLSPILAGVVTFESDWNPPLGEPFERALATDDPARRLDLGCVAAHGTFRYTDDDAYALTHGGKPATAFLFDLIGRLQQQATVSMIDVAAYAAWLT